jgi:hypothetical protein
MKKTICVFVLTVFAATAFAQSGGTVALYEDNNPWPAKTGTLEQCLAYLDAALEGKPGAKYGRYVIEGKESTRTIQPVNIGGWGDAARLPTAPMIFPNIKNLVQPLEIIISGEDDGSTVLSLAAPGSMFTLDGRVTMTLSNITLKGLMSTASINTVKGYFSTAGITVPASVFPAVGTTADNTAPLIYMWHGTTLILNEGAVITGNHNAGSDGGAGIMVKSAKLVINNGAVISGNAHTVNDLGGGGVYCTASEIEMNGGAVEYNYTSDADYGGGGMSITGGGTLAMRGGSISYNYADECGGGVNLIFGAGNNMTMSGNSKINGNYSAELGGGVSISEGNFTMSGGTIGGNTAHQSGGGVNGTFTMTGGIIYGYKGTKWPGGTVSAAMGNSMELLWRAFSWNKSSFYDNIIMPNGGTVGNWIVPEDQRSTTVPVTFDGFSDPANTWNGTNQDDIGANNGTPVNYGHLTVSVP